MKVVGCMLFYHIGVVFLLLTCIISLGIHKSIIVSGEIDVVTITSSTTSSINRQLKDNIDDSMNDKGLYDGAVSLDDYRPYDPSPSSKASVRGAPIEHGTPLMPYIPSPKPSPPNHSDQDDPSPGPSVTPDVHKNLWRTANRWRVALNDKAVALCKAQKYVSDLQAALAQSQIELGRARAAETQREQEIAAYRAEIESLRAELSRRDQAN